MGWYLDLSVGLFVGGQVYLAPTKRPQSVILLLEKALSNASHAQTAIGWKEIAQGCRLDEINYWHPPQSTV